MAVTYKKDVRTRAVLIVLHSDLTSWLDTSLVCGELDISVFVVCSALDMY